MDERPDQPGTSPEIGVDEWVSREEERRAQSLTNRAADFIERIPPIARLALIVVPLALFPVFAGSDFLRQVGLDTLIFVLLVLGLNVTVGWVGLLDLG
jgi:ABC-type proline/glycine betaine transport system permease subunit